jgi:hypothetical protein
VLAGWFGSWTLFALVIAPTAFQVLPSQAAAGTMVGPVLRALHNYGIFAGITLALLGGLLRRGKLAIVIPVVLTALCAISEYLITPAIAELQPRSFGVDQEKEAAERFSNLHQISRYLFGIVQLGTLGLIVLYARPDSDGRAGSTPQSGA